MSLFFLLNFFISVCSGPHPHGRSIFLVAVALAQLSTLTGLTKIVSHSAHPSAVSNTQHWTAPIVNEGRRQNTGYGTNIREEMFSRVAFLFRLKNIAPGTGTWGPECAIVTGRVQFIRKGKKPSTVCSENAIERCTAVLQCTAKAQRHTRGVRFRRRSRGLLISQNLRPLGSAICDETTG